MSLETRIVELATALGADIKDLQAQITTVDDKPEIVVSATQPENPAVGDVWIDPDAGIQNPGTVEPPYTGGGCSSQIYSTVGDLPASGIANSTLAYVSSNNSLYMQSDGQWKRVYTGSDSALEVTTEPPPEGLIRFEDTSVKEHVISLAATDPDGFPVTYGYAINPADSEHILSVTNNNGVYTLQTTSNGVSMGHAVFRATATDGLHVVSRSQALTFTMAFPIGLSGGTASSTVYTAPNGTVVTASDPTYATSVYSLSFLFNNSISTGGHGNYWLSSTAIVGTLTFNFTNSTVSYLDTIEIFPRTRADSFTSVTSIQISTDGIEWTTLPNTSMVVTSALAFGYSETFSLATTNQYVRLNLTRTSGGLYLSLDEIRFEGITH